MLDQPINTFFLLEAVKRTFVRKRARFNYALTSHSVSRDSKMMRFVSTARMHTSAFLRRLFFIAYL